MKIALFLLIMLCTCFSSTAQNKKPGSNQSLQLDIGFSKHGTGDMQGLILNTEYKKFFRQKLSLAFGISATIHDGSSSTFYTNGDGRLVDASYRYATGGLQLTGKFGVSLYQYGRHELGAQAGALLRYQTSSYFDEFTELYPAATGLPVPVAIIVHQSPQKTLALGGIAQLFYNFALNQKIFIGITPALQADTNGDTISTVALSCGFKL